MAKKMKALKAPTLDRDLIQAAEAAQVIGITTGNLYVLRHNKVLDAVTLGRSIWFSRRQCEEIRRQRATWGKPREKE